MTVFLYQVYQARLQEYLLTLQGLRNDLKCVLEADPGKLDMKRCKPGFPFISLPS